MGDDAAKKKEGQKDDDEDERLEFLLNYLTKSYRLKQEKWNKMIIIDENKVTYVIGFDSIFVFFLYYICNLIRYFLYIYRRLILRSFKQHFFYS